MTEAEWLNENDAYPRQFLVVQEHASIRKMRLIAAAFVRGLQRLLESGDAKLCEDLIEAAADRPRPWDEFESELYARPGNWRFAHILWPTDTNGVVKALRKLVAFNHTTLADYPLRLIHEVIGNPFRPVTFSPSWRTSTVVALAAQMYESRDFGAMPILADALQDAGCDNADVLEHCRGPEPHVRGCWVVDLVLGKQ